MVIAIDINDVIRDYTRQFIKYYQKVVDPSFEIEYDDVTDYDFTNIFPFIDNNGETDTGLYNQFKYEDCAFELFGRADVMERRLPSEFNLWTQNTLKNFDEEKIPTVMIVSPFEMGLSIQSTLAFLSRIGMRVREYYFPIDSNTIWDKCDVLITANPNLIANKPEGKHVFKINTPYNKNTETLTEFTFDSLCDIIHDENNTLINLIENSEK